MIRYSRPEKTGLSLSDGRGASRVFVLLILLLCTIALTSCRYPRDIEGTLDKVKGGFLDVGVTENAPWVIRTDTGAVGLEPDIVMDLAEKLDAEVRWHWGNESALLEALKQFQLDLVIGGLTKSKRLSSVAALTKPYFSSVYTVGVPRPAPLPLSLDDLTVTVPAVNHLHKALVGKGAQPITSSTAATTDGAVAAPTWWLRAHGFEPGPWKLATDKHVFALPKGENGWMMVTQRHLNGLSGLGERLQKLEAGG